MDDDALLVDLSSMTVEDYLTLTVALDDDDRLVMLDVLDKYAGGRLRQAPWPVWFAALEQAMAQLQPVEDALSEAQTQAVWANMVSKPTWAKQ